MSNLKTVYSPAGDKFEVSALNANDLTSHCGYSTKNPLAANKAAAEAAEVTKAEALEEVEAAELAAAKEKEEAAKAEAAANKSEADKGEAKMSKSKANGKK